MVAVAKTAVLPNAPVVMAFGADLRLDRLKIIGERAWPFLVVAKRLAFPDCAVAGGAAGARLKHVQMGQMIECRERPNVLSRDRPTDLSGLRNMRMCIDQTRQAGHVRQVQHFAVKLGAADDRNDSLVCNDNSLVMRATGDTMIISPPLIISEAEIDVMVEKIWAVLDQTETRLKADGVH